MPALSISYGLVEPHSRLCARNGEQGAEFWMELLLAVLEEKQASSLLWIQ